MSLNASVWLVILVALLAANLPFFNDRILAVGPLRQPKTLWWRVLELLVCYFVVGAVGLGLEHSVGQIYPQGWEFYATTAALFLTFAFPGFTWRYLFHRRH
ncbi:DUF2818 family protein [Hydrogenophaga bisanensis]|jgi:hypothetical protein|uniref:DUF2818 family protein n=1 Tax=Hydrogenophaga bisanensis TaxID=439611 RepID=A0ABW2R7R1_9BURK|nr:DUF2818 family protein [Hydrogenophaga sp.]